MRRNVSGFTIVELLIVIVVIAILAAISIVAYSGIQDSARKSAAQSAVKQVANKASVHMAETEACPASLSAMNIADSDTTKYQYSCDNSSNPSVYCVTATVAGHTYYFDSAVRRTPTPGTCATYNYLATDDTAATKPVLGGTLDTAVFRSGPASIRLGPGESGRALRDSPFSGSAGQVYNVGLWIRTDSNWNGTGSNSKIRYGSATGSLLKACGYEGVKTSWMYVSCDYMLTSANTTITISVGNDGSVGNIWLDDITLTRSY